MKKIRFITLSSLVLFTICIYLKLNKLVTTLDLIKSVILGGLVSVSVLLPMEISTFKISQKQKIDDFLWKAVIPYLEDMDELFLFSRDMFYTSEIYFKDIPLKYDNWEDYIDIYKSSYKHIDYTMDGYVREIKNNSKKYNDLSRSLSYLIKRIEIYDVFKNEREDFKLCYRLFKIINDINHHLLDVGKLINDINEIDDDLEKKCNQIIVCRYLSDKYCKSYKRSTDKFDIRLDDIDMENENLIARKDLNTLIFELSKYI